MLWSHADGTDSKPSNAKLWKSSTTRAEGLLVHSRPVAVRLLSRCGPVAGAFGGPMPIASGSGWHMSCVGRKVALKGTPSVLGVRQAVPPPKQAASSPHGSCVAIASTVRSAPPAGAAHAFPPWSASSGRVPATARQKESTNSCTTMPHRIVDDALLAPPQPMLTDPMRDIKHSVRASVSYVKHTEPSEPEAALSGRKMG
mmetsp:Transcript_20696/g.47731  ORF Transcript_20696/g.47731 Transcript_20696/m.47731 type:complete len:200 (-) Transcript_20696:260-859(-)